MTAEGSALVVVLVVMVGAVGLVIGVLLLRERAEQRRLARLAAWAAEAGWTCSTTGNPGLLTRWKGAPFVHVGVDPGIDDVLTGHVDGFPATSLRFGYTLVVGKAQKRVRFHVVAIELPASLPTVEVLPEVAAMRVGKAIGAARRDLQFESEDFNQRWFVMSPDPRLAHSIIHPGLMEWMLGAPEVMWRIEGSSLLTWSPGSTDVDEVLPKARHLVSVAQAIPRFVWLEHGFDPARSED